MTEPYNVLILCTGNSARSILAEAILNRMGEGRFKAYSAGSMPAGRVNPHAIRLLENLNYPTDGLRSKSWDEFQGESGPKFDFVVTVCDNAAGETCPYYAGAPVKAHWGIPDPAAATGTDAQIALAFANAYRQLSQRIGLFVNLPLASLDKISLKHQMDLIGQTQDAQDAPAPQPL